MARKRVRTKKRSGGETPYLSAISFLNLKAFGDWQTLPIKPLNLIFGKNSSGKSSIFHALLWFRDVLYYGDLNVTMPETSGEFVDLGGLWQFVHFNSKKQKKLGVRLHIHDPTKILFQHIENEYLKNDPQRSEIGWPKELLKEALKTLSSVREAFHQGEEDLNYTLEAQFDLEGFKQKEKFQPIFIRPEVRMYVNKIKILEFIPLKKTREVPEGHSVFSKWNEDYEIGWDKEFFQDKIIPEFAKLAENISWNRVSQRNQNKKWIPTPEVLFDRLQKYRLTRASSARDPQGAAIFPEKGKGLDFISRLNAYTESSLYSSDPEAPSQEGVRLGVFGTLLDDVLNNVSLIAKKATENFFGKINYLAAYRSYPDREISQKVMRNVRHEPHGSESYRDTISNSKIVHHLNRACKKLGGDFELRISRDIKEWAGDRLQILKNGYELSFRDIGFGWSQVMPVLVELVQCRYSALFIEQPELHLHPSNQSELMDVVLEIIAKGRGSIAPVFLELHSEQMVLRLLRRIKESSTGNGRIKVMPESCAIIYVKKSNGCSKINILRVSEDGSMRDPWPGGFFESALKDC